MLDKLKQYSALGLSIVFLILLLIQTCRLKNVPDSSFKLNDTVYVNKPYPVIKIQTIEKPVLTIIYKTDTVLRKQYEKENIITQVTFNPSHNFFNRRKLDFKVGKIDTKGKISLSEYHATNAKQININNKGEVEVKRKNFLGLKIGGTIVLTGLTYLGGKAIYMKYIIK